MGVRKTYYCDSCKEDFQEGGIIIETDQGIYHGYALNKGETKNYCLTKHIIYNPGHPTITNQFIQHKGRFYGLDNDSREIVLEKFILDKKIEVNKNEAETGDIITGDLESLTKKLGNPFNL
jgi:hypothetical protein